MDILTALRNDKPSTGEIVGERDGWRDFPVKFCEKCNRCWEPENPSSGYKAKNILYLKDFPKLGIKHQTCPDCRRHKWN